MTSKTSRIAELKARVKRYSDALELKGDNVRREDAIAARKKIEEMKSEITEIEAEHELS